MHVTLYFLYAFLTCFSPPYFLLMQQRLLNAFLLFCFLGLLVNLFFFLSQNNTFFTAFFSCSPSLFLRLQFVTSAVFILSLLFFYLLSGYSTAVIIIFFSLPWLIVFTVSTFSSVFLAHCRFICNFCSLFFPFSLVIFTF